MNWETRIFESMLKNFIGEGIYIDALVEVIDHSGKRLSQDATFIYPTQQ